MRARENIERDVSWNSDGYCKHFSCICGKERRQRFTAAGTEVYNVLRNDEEYQRVASKSERVEKENVRSSRKYKESVLGRAICIIRT